MRFTILALFLAWTSMNVVRADDLHTIKLKLDPDVGKTITIKNNQKDTGYLKFFDENGKLISDEKPEGELAEWQATVLGKDKAGNVSKVLRVYHKVRTITEGKEKTRSYEGATILTETIDKVVHLGVAGDKQLDQKDIDRLVDRNSKKSDWRLILENLTPKKAVKVGETWSLDAKATLSEVKEYTPLIEKSTLTATLTKVFTKGTTKMGVITLEANVMFTKAFGVIEFDPPGKTVYKGTIECAIDGTSTERKEDVTEDVVGNGVFNVPQKKGRVEIKGGGQTISEISAEKDDAQARNMPKMKWVAGPNAWMEFVSKEHAFKALFPGKPQSQTKKDQFGYPTTQYTIGTEGGAVAYIVAVTEFPADAPIMADAILLALEKGPDVLDKSVIKMNGFPGREFTLNKGTKDKPVPITQRVYVVKQRMYQVLYVESEGKKGDKAKFFENFRFDDKQAGKDD